MRAYRLTSFSLTLALAGAALISTSAHASGFAVARFGGGHGNPISTTPASIYYNPGAMAFVEGTNIYADYTLAWRKAKYDRVIGSTDEWSVPNPDVLNEQIQRQTNEGEGTLDNLIGSPMIALTTDFGGSNVVLGAGFYVPFGGSAVWDEQDLDSPAAEEAPFAVDGPQRWHTIDGSIRVLTAALAVAARTEDDRFGFGISANLNITQVDTIRGRNGSGGDEVVRDNGEVLEGRSQVEADGIDPSIGVGVRYEAIKDRLMIGASWQSGPNITGNQELEGTLTNELQGGAIPRAETDIYFVQRLPQTFRWGLAYRFLEDPDGEDSDVKAEVRLTGDILTWENFEHQCLVDRSSAGVDGDRIEARRTCTFKENGSYADPDATGVIQNIPRRWRTAGGVKLGASNYLSDMFELNYSVSFDSSAVPDRTMDPVLMDMPKVTLDIGAVIDVTDWLEINLLVANVFYFNREITDSGLYEFDAPSVQPAANGKYSQNILLGNLGLNFHF